MLNASVRGDTRNSPQSKAAFLAAVLEPVTAVELVDFGYNRDMRNARERQWKLAYWSVRRARLLLDYVRATESYRSAKRGKHIPILRDFDILLPRHRAAQALLIRTPAPDEAALALKRSTAKDAEWLPIKADEIAQLIAADVAFLAVHPVTRRAAAKTAARQI